MSGKQHKPNLDEDNFVESNRDVLELLDRVWRQDEMRGHNSSLPYSRDATPQVDDGQTIDLEQTAQDFSSNTLVDADDFEIQRNRDLPETIGRFRIRKLLGQGGFGLVFLAHDPRLKRDVALKIPRPEALVTDELKSRFIREAETAASLNHANIVPVFEAGSYGLIYYIAAGFCNGPALSQWLLEESNPVSPELAADILVNLADAIQHAHSRGIVHRDLKPQNILIESVSNDPTHIQQPVDIPYRVMITDFGLAKSSQDSAEITRTGSVVGTPSYMSPEQISSGRDEVGPASDIYSLGAVLYFLLTGRPPFAGASLLETIKLVAEQPPTPVCKLRPDVPRDLEAICLKCLEKEASRRYQTASDFQADLLRFQKGLPVLARKSTALDRALMWTRRRPMVAGLAMTLLIVLSASSIALGILLANANTLKERATESAARATAERDRARNALDSMTSGVATSWLSGQGELSTEQKAFLNETISYYRQFADDESEDPEDQFWVANANRHLSELQAQLGQLNEALQSIDRSIESLERIPPEWDSEKVLLEMVKTLRQKETFIHETGDVNKSLPVAQRAADLARELVELRPNDIEARHQLAATLGSLGSRLGRLKRLDESLLAHTESVVIHEKLAAESSPELKTTFQRQLGIQYLNLGILLSQTRNHDDAREMLEKSLLIRRELAEVDPDSARYRSDLGYVLDSQGGLATRINEFGSAETFYNDALQLRRRLVEQFPIDESYRRNLVKTLSNLSIVLNRQRKFDDSEPVIKELIAVADHGREFFPDVSYYHLASAIANSNLANALSEKGQPEEAIQFHDAAVEVLEKIVEQGLDGQNAFRQLESALCQRATALGYLDRHKDAIADWDAAIAITRPEGVNTLRLCRATSVVKDGDIDDALNDVEQILAETMQLVPEKRDFNIFYNSACVHSLVSTRVNDEDESRRHAFRAIDLLNQSVALGFQPLSHLESDPELAPLHEFPEFQNLLK